MKNFSLKKENALFLFVDIQEKLLKAINEKERVLKNCEILSKASNIMGMDSLLTAQYPKGLGFNMDEIKNPIKNPKEISKISFSCMLNDEFVSELKKTNKKQVIICGIEAHICVLLTARDLINAGYEVFVAADAVGSRNDLNYKNALDLMKDMGCVVTNTESILFDLNSIAGTDEFKAVQKLII